MRGQGRRGTCHARQNARRAMLPNQAADYPTTEGSLVTDVLATSKRSRPERLLHVCTLLLPSCVLTIIHLADGVVMTQPDV